MLLYFKNTEEFLDQVESELEPYFETVKWNKDVGADLVEEHAENLEVYCKENWKEKIMEQLNSWRGKELFPAGDVEEREDYWDPQMPTMFIETSDLWDTVADGQEFDWAVDMVLGELYEWLVGLPHITASGE